jgi:HEAT repeat protein
MKRLVLILTILALPLAAAAQTPPTPPPAPLPPVAVPAPEAVPVPMIPPVPPTPRAPRVLVPPVYVDQEAIREAIIAGREWQIDTEHIKEQAKIAAEQAKIAAEDAKIHLRLSPFEHPFEFTFQDRMFSTTQEGDSNFSQGQSHMSQRQYEQAIMRFDRTIAQKSSRADAALYYKAYAQFKLGKTEDAVVTVTQLRKEYPQSRYLNDAKVLETEARRLKPQDIVDDDEMKLIAIGAMQQADAERAVPLLEEVLNRNNSLRVKKGALYQLALKSDQPRARAILLNYAKGGGNPDLQLEAIRYIAQNRDRQTTSTELQQIYQTTQDTAVKLAIISAFRQSGNTPALVNIVNSVNTPVEIRRSAINGIAGIGVPQDLWVLYQKEENKDLRMQMISAFGSMQAFDQLSQVLKTEKDPEVRRRAVRSLGSLKADQSGKLLVDMYGTEQDIETRQAVISALGNQNNADALVAIARKEQNLQLRTTIIKRLADMVERSKVAADFMAEIIKK